MADIKTRNVVKGTVKNLDRPSAVSEHMKSATIRTKDAAEQSINSNEVSTQEYSTNRLEAVIETITAGGAKRINKKGENGFRDTKKYLEKVKNSCKKFKNLNKTNKPKKITEKTKRATQKAVKTAGKGTVKTAQATGKGTVKTAQNTIKTAKNTGKVAVKTSQTTVKTARGTAKVAAKAAKAAALAIKATFIAAKIAIKALIASAKLAIAATKAIVAAIAAGGWVAVVIIIVICLIALIVESSFGIFFSNEDTGSEQTTQTVVQEINTEYQTQIEAIKNNISYDVLEMSDAYVMWDEVLSVYAVKTTTDPDDAQEVVTMDNSKKAILKDIFWQMNTISSRTETKTETVTTETEDGNGNVVQTETIVTRTYLYITVNHKTADEMANLYAFSTDQKTQLMELLATENSRMWDEVA